MARKLVMAVLIAALALIAYSLWLFGRDHAEFTEHRAQMLATVERERETTRGKLAEQTRVRDEKNAALELQRQRNGQAEKVLKTLHELDPGALDRVFGDPERRKAHEAQIARMESLRTETQTRIVELQRESLKAGQERDALVARLSALDHEYAELNSEENAVSHYLRMAWKEVHWLVAGVFLAYLFGGLVAAIVLYYGWANWVGRGRATQLTASEAALPVIGESGVVVEDSVWPGEVLRVRRRFLHAGNEGLHRRTRFLLSWRMPVSCFAAGLTRLAELRNDRSEGERQVVFACADDHFAEMAIVSVPEGGAFVLRASFLMGIIANAQQPPAIRRHWRFFKWQSWVSGQFGYLEFAGPCRLLVSCVSALRSETLQAREDAKPVLRRAAQAGIVGFSPRLQLKPVRTEGFWRYCRSRAPLFDVQLSGNGAVLLREAEGRGRDVFRSRLLKRCGL